MWAQIVENAVAALSVAEEQPGADWVECPSESGVSIGWTHDGVTFTAPLRTTIPAGDFLDRFTPQEQGAVQVAAQANPQIMLGLTIGLARGVIDLRAARLAAWMAALVAAGALTDARRTEIMTP